MPKKTSASTRLSFLNDMLFTESEQKEIISSKLGMTRQALNAILRVDDCRISTLYRIAAALNFEIKIEYDIPKNDTMLIVRKGPGISEKKLQGLLELMKYKDMNTEDIAKVLEISPTGFNYILRNDDTRISNLYKIAEKLNTKLIVSIAKKED